MEPTQLRGSERPGPSGGSTGSGILRSHTSPSLSQVGGGARWALPTASVLNDLWPKSGVREGLSKGGPEGLASPAEARGFLLCTSISCLVLAQRNYHRPLCGPQRKD